MGGCVGKGLGGRGKGGGSTAGGAGSWFAHFWMGVGGGWVDGLVVMVVRVRGGESGIVEYAEVWPKHARIALF